MKHRKKRALFTPLKHQIHIIVFAKKKHPHRRGEDFPLFTFPLLTIKFHMVIVMMKPGLGISEKEKDLMDRATYLKFIVGLAEEIRGTGLTQEAFAVSAKTSKTNLSRVLNDKSGCSPRWRKKVCAALGTTEDAVIARGGRENNPQASPVSPVLPPVPESMDIVAAVATFAKNAAVTEEKLRFWKDIFEYIPAAICLLRDGIVLYQNQANRRLCPSAIIGKNLCQTCKDKGEGNLN